MNKRREWFDKSFSFGLVLQLMIKHIDKKKRLSANNFLSDFQLHDFSLRLPPAIEKKIANDKILICSESMALLTPRE